MPSVRRSGRWWSGSMAGENLGRLLRPRTAAASAPHRWPTELPDVSYVEHTEEAPTTVLPMAAPRSRRRPRCAARSRRSQPTSNRVLSARSASGALGRESPSEWPSRDDGNASYSAPSGSVVATTPQDEDPQSEIMTFEPAVLEELALSSTITRAHAISRLRVGHIGSSIMLVSVPGDCSSGRLHFGECDLRLRDSLPTRRWTFSRSHHFPQGSRTDRE